jgi:integrase
MIENPKVSLFNRKGKLYVQYYLNGKCIQKSLKKDYTKENVKLAKKFVIPEIERKILLGEINDKKNVVREFDFYASIFLKQKENLKKYKEIENIVINQFYPVFGKNTKIDKITRGVVRQWVDQKLQKVTPQRVKRLLNTLAAIFDIAIQYEHIETNPAKNIILPPPKKVREMKPFTPEEIKILIDNAKGYFKNYLAIAFFTGMRPGEIVALTLSDINLTQIAI